MLKKEFVFKKKIRKKIVYCDFVDFDGFCDYKYYS